MEDQNHIETQNFDLSQFEQIFKEQFKPLCAFAYKYLNDIDLSKEIVHDVFVNLWHKRENIQMDKSIKSYLYTSINNRCLNFIRDNKKFVKNCNQENYMYNPDNVLHTDFLVENEIKSKISETLEQLPEKCRKVFEMSRYDGKKYKEIAKELDVSIKTVEAHMSKALKALKENLTEFLTILVFICFWN